MSDHYKPKEQENEAQHAQSQPINDKSLEPIEIGGPDGPEPTRFGDRERKGRVSDF